MGLIEAIREKVLADAFEFSQHAVDQAILRHISVQQIREAVGTGRVIEDYPDDKYGPSCLVLGFATNGKAIHSSVQLSFPVPGENYHGLRARPERLDRLRAAKRLG